MREPLLSHGIGQLASPHDVRRRQVAASDRGIGAAGFVNREPVSYPRSSEELGPRGGALIGADHVLRRVDKALAYAARSRCRAA